MSTKKEPAFLSGKSEAYKELYAEYRQLAKRADQRIVRLEKLSQETGFKTATDWAYRKATKAAQDYSKGQSTRFNTAPPDNYQQLQAKINAINEFLESPSSTKKGIVSIYKSKADTLNAKYGTDFSWQQLAKFWISGEGDRLKSRFGSATMMAAIATIQKSDQELIDKIREVDEKIDIVPDKELSNVINEILKDDSISLETILKAGK